MDALSRYDWPGNVRELQNVAERMLFLSGGNELTAQYLPQHILEATSQSYEKTEHCHAAVHGAKSFVHS